jgi:hypothetical protein
MRKIESLKDRQVSTMKNLKDTVNWLITISCGIFLAYFLIESVIKN